MTSRSFYPDFFENFSIKEIGTKLSPKEKFRIKNRLNSLQERLPAIPTGSLKSYFNEQENQKLNSKSSHIDEKLLNEKKYKFLNKHLGQPSESFNSQLVGGN